MNIVWACEKCDTIFDVVAPVYNEELSYAMNDWIKIQRWIAKVMGQLYVIRQFVYHGKLKTYIYILHKFVFQASIILWFAIIY